MSLLIFEGFSKLEFHLKTSALPLSLVISFSFSSHFHFVQKKPQILANIFVSNTFIHDEITLSDKRKKLDFEKESLL